MITCDLCGERMACDSFNHYKVEGVNEVCQTCNPIVEAKYSEFIDGYRKEAANAFEEWIRETYDVPRET